MKLYNLRKAPKCPYDNLKWDRYYWKHYRKVPKYESDYWGKVKDPDGNLRNMLSDVERKKQIEDTQFIIKTINALHPGKILDVGCGPGYLLSAVNSRWQKYGTDVSVVALKQANRFAKVKRGELPNLGFNSDCFDVVIMNHVIEHLKDPIRYVQECFRILKPNGTYIIATPDFDSGCARWFGKNYRMLCDKGHVSLFTSFSLVKMLEDFQFQIQEIEYPFFKDRWFTRGNLLRMLDRSKISPPFYGNHIVVVARKSPKRKTVSTMYTPFLKGERIYLTKLDDRFIKDMFEYSKRPEFYAYMELKPVKTMKEMRKYLEKLLNRVRQGNTIYWAIVLNSSDKMIGTFGVADIDINSRNARIGYAISPDYWNQGYLKEALAMVLGYCFEKVGLERITTVTMSGNLGSIKGLEHAGFRREGILKQYYRKSDGSRYDGEISSLLKTEFLSRKARKA